MRKKFGRLKRINQSNLKQETGGPGVYGLYTEGSRLLKVGRAKRGRTIDRIIESAKEINRAKKFGVISTDTVKEAIKLETQLIRKRKPLFNKERKGK